MNSIGVFTFIRRELERLKRVGIQTLVTPWISALLYIVIFGEIVGRRIGVIAGVNYIDFVVPGLLMMNVMQSAFMHASSSLYFARFLRNIEEILTAPFSYGEIIASYLISGVLRAAIVGSGVYVIALFFTVATIYHFWLFLFYILAVSAVFSLAGLLVGLWAENFEQLSIPTTFVIMPLSFLGGMFNSIHMIPERFQMAVKLNPFFYFVDGIRYSMIGVSESNRWIGIAMIVMLLIVLGAWVWILFKRGYKIKT